MLTKRFSSTVVSYSLVFPREILFVNPIIITWASPSYSCPACNISTHPSSDSSRLNSRKQSLALVGSRKYLGAPIGERPVLSTHKPPPEQSNASNST